MLEFWNNRYSQDDYAYGKKPNDFFRQQLIKLNPGKLLLPAEGEGRNAVLAAKYGWNVEAFDYSQKAVEKAMKLAKASGSSYTYSLAEYQSFNPKNVPFDCVALIYTHSAPEARSAFNKKIYNWLNPGGVVILEGFSKAQLGNDSGGPKKKEMLWSEDELKADFKDLHITYLQELEVELDEGPYHKGRASVIRMVAKKEEDDK